MMKRVLITGASSGIGRSCANYLSGQGYRVFAGVRKPEDAEAFRGSGIEPVIIDVTDEESIAAAVAYMDKVAGGLDCLVNNAGIAPTGPLETVPVAKIRQLMEVNLIGLLAVTRAFLPMLRASKGRIVNMGSSAGILAAPGWSSYAASKFGVEAVTDSLRLELKSFGIRVSVINPGIIETPLWSKGTPVQHQVDEIDPEIKTIYAPLIRSFTGLFESPNAIPAEEVAKAVAHALGAKRPRYRYLVGTWSDVKGMALLAKLPTALRDHLLYGMMCR